MLLRTFFIVDSDKYENLPDLDLPADACISYKIKSSSISRISALYKKIFLTPKKNPFCLLIDINEEFDKSKMMLELLVSFSFHFMYKRDNFDNPVILFENNDSDSNNYISIIREAFEDQGYSDIETIDLYKKNGFLPESRNKNIFFNVEDNFSGLSTSYINSIKNITTSDCSSFFFIKYPEKLPEILKTIEHADITIANDMPQAYALLNENKALKLKVNELLSQIELYRQQQSSSAEYGFSNSSLAARYKKQISELLAFYRNEYEILPVWYKRLGHIVKVVTGKRTLKSLFNDNVKKYKD
ncbi:MAG: hypothetical protein ABUT20_28310 [Bacteroidota bacterium]